MFNYVTITLLLLLFYHQNTFFYSSKKNNHLILLHNLPFLVFLLFLIMGLKSIQNEFLQLPCQAIQGHALHLNDSGKFNCDADPVLDPHHFSLRMRIRILDADPNPGSKIRPMILEKSSMTWNIQGYLDSGSWYIFSSFLNLTTKLFFRKGCMKNIIIEK